MSFPFRGKKFRFTQPDGKTFSVVGWGDQHMAVFETEGGYTIVPDDEQIYRYAVLSPSGNLVPTAARADEPPPSIPGVSPGLRPAASAARDIPRRFPPGSRRCEQRWQERQTLDTDRRAPPSRGTIGTYRGLCLLVDFPDVPATIARDAVDRFCNLPGYSEFGNNGSVYDYFLDNSRERLKYTNVVTEYYTAKQPLSYYTDESRPDGERARELIQEALTALKAQGFDFSQLSADSRGYIYAVNVFYAGECPNNWGKGLWPHCWSLARPLRLATGRQAFDYQMTNMGSELSIATFCHENGHMVCDFPDLYDYGDQSNGAGNFCLMAFAGSDAKNPVNVSAYLRYKAGWIGKVRPLTDGAQASIGCDGDEVLIHTKSAREYFLVENRFRKHRDRSLPASGLAIWHVDEQGSNDDEQMTTARHYECSLEQADGKFDLERNKNGGDAGDLFAAPARTTFSDATTPNAKWWSGTPSGLVLRDISAPGEVMTLWCGEGAPSQPMLTGEAAPDLAIPDNKPKGVTSAITLAGAAAEQVGSVEVDVQIAHPYVGDLRVALTSPAGTTVVLHDRNGGGTSDLRKRFDVTGTPALKAFAGEAVAGEWTLKVQDLAPKDTGTLERWSLSIARASATGAALAEDPGAAIPDDAPQGIARSLTCAADLKLSRVEVEVDITHTYVGDLTVALVAPSGTTVVLHDRAGGAEDNLRRSFSSATNAELAALAGQDARGAWTLKVADHEGQDTGKLARWSLRLD